MAATQQELAEVQAQLHAAGRRIVHLQNRLAQAFKLLGQKESELAGSRLELSKARRVQTTLERELINLRRDSDHYLATVSDQLKDFLETTGQAQRALLKVARRAIAAEASARSARSSPASKASAAAKADRETQKRPVPVYRPPDPSAHPRAVAEASPDATAIKVARLEEPRRAVGQDGMDLEPRGDAHRRAEDEIFAQLVTTSEHQIIVDRNRHDMDRLSADSFVGSFRRRAARRSSERS